MVFLLSLLQHESLTCWTCVAVWSFSHVLLMQAFQPPRHSRMACIKDNNMELRSVSFPKSLKFHASAANPAQALHRRLDDVQRQVDWLRTHTVQRDTQLDTVLERLQSEEQRRPLKRSTSFYGVFGL